MLLFFLKCLVKMSTPSWTVVKFLEENSVEAVPTSWINNNKCYWPALQRDKLATAIRKNQSPDINWPLYEVTIFRNSTYDNYMLARQKARKAESISDFNSEISADEENKKRRKIVASKEQKKVTNNKKSIYHSSSEDDEYRFLPTPPPLEETENNTDEDQNIEVHKGREKPHYIEDEEEENIKVTHGARKDTLANPCPGTSFSNPSPSVRNSNCIDNGKEKENNEIDQDYAEPRDARINTFVDPLSEESFPTSPSINLKTSNHISRFTSRQVVARQNSEDNFGNPSNKENIQFNNSMKCTCKLCPAHVNMQNKNEIYFKEIIRQQNYFKAQLWQTSEDIRDLKNRQNQTNDNVQNQESIFSYFTLPLETEQQLEEIEQFLKNEDNFKTSVIQASHSGGKHAYEFVKRNFNQLLNNKLAEKYSWFGKKQKKKFCELKLAEMLIAAGEAYNASFTRKELEEAVQKWLRRAKERADASEKKLANQMRNE